MRYTKTKIIATIGPSSANKQCILKMKKQGMDIVRLNFSHGTHNDHKKIIDIVNDINKVSDTKLAILCDIQGPKIRVGETKPNSILNKDDIVCLTSRELISDKQTINVKYQNLANDVQQNDLILIDDGKIRLKAGEKINNTDISAKVIIGGELKSRKGVNLPDTKLSFPSLTEKDIIDLDFILTQNIHWIALSFVRTANDVKQLRSIINKNTTNNKPLIIAKIEKPEAVENINAIIKESDAIMVARGDLGIEIPLEKVPGLQKKLVKKCLKLSRPIIVATQMMEGMIDNLNPTRAEVNDVANAVMDGADALMLSAETSVGKFPVEVIETMEKIIRQIELDNDVYYKHILPNSKNTDRYLSDSILYGACEIAKSVKAEALITMTQSGYSAIHLSSNRPKSDIYVFTDNEKLLSTLSLVWGVRGYYYKETSSTDGTINDVIEILKKKRLLKKKDFVINIASIPIKEMGKTNMIKLSKVE